MLFFLAKLVAILELRLLLVSRGIEKVCSSGIQIAFCVVIRPDDKRKVDAAVVYFRGNGFPSSGWKTGSCSQPPPGCRRAQRQR
jgi:hypothetical protein